MQILETMSGYFTNTVDVGDTVDSTQSTSDSTLATVTETADGFTAMLSTLTLGDSSTSAQSDELVSGIQSAFMRSLGLGEGADEALNLLTSDEGLAKLQGSLLSVLKTDLLKSVVSASSSDAQGVTEEVIETESVDSENMASSDWATFLDSAFGEDGVDWNDGFDAVNLLHHIPLVSDFYQNVSSSHISAASDLAGSFLYGGPAGLAYSAVNLGVKEMTGDSITNHLWSAGHDWLFSEETTGTDESVTEGVVGEHGEAVAQSAYQFARRKFDAD